MSEKEDKTNSASYKSECPTLTKTRKELIENPPQFYLYSDDVEEELVCPICTFPFCTPYVHNECGNSFCHTCSALTNTCPLCRKQWEIYQNLKPSTMKLVINLLDKLVVKCSCCRVSLKRSDFEHHYNKICEITCPNNCGTKTTRDNLPIHWSQCPHTIIPCSNQNRGCSHFLPRKNLDSHLSLDCFFQPLICPFSLCETYVERRVFEEHKESCGFAPMECRRGCGTNFVRAEMNSHEEECLEMEVECGAVGIGCDFKGKRKELGGHVVGCSIMKMHSIIVSLLQMQQQSDAKIKDLTEKQQQLETQMKSEKQQSEYKIQSLTEKLQQLLLSDAKIKDLTEKQKQLETQMKSEKQQSEYKIQSLTEKLQLIVPNIFLEWDTSAMDLGLVVCGTIAKGYGCEHKPRNILVKGVIQGKSKVTFKLLNSSACYEAVGIISRSEFVGILEIQKWVWRCKSQLSSGACISLVVNTFKQEAKLYLNGTKVDGYRHVVGTDLQFVATLCCSSHIEIVNSF